MLKLPVIPLVVRATRALIGGIHIHQVFVRAPVYDLPVIPRGKRHPSGQYGMGRHYAAAHFLWPGSFPAVVWGVVELPVAVEPDCGLYAPRKQVKKVVGAVRLVEAVAHRKEEPVLVAALLVSQPRIVVRKPFRAVQYLVPQFHKRLVCVVEPRVGGGLVQQSVYCDRGRSCKGFYDPASVAWKM
ncbi:MAG: hypothetical protein K8823_1044 [Cenarchaeum symbiont of Oopsacas minuta]|nr:hypothetical protein [Cenarchaeum symbiont of Oopsacas minuta]